MSATFQRMAAAALVLGAVLTLHAAPARAADAVTVRLSWTLSGEMAFFFTGKEKGIYEKHGLNPEFLEGRGTVAAAQAVANKRDTFGYGGGAGYFLSRSKGVPVKMVALVFQRGPMLLVSWPDKPVRTPKDIEGKSIVLTPGESFHSLWPAFAAAHGIDRSKVKEVTVGIEARTQAFLQKQVDVTPDFVTTVFRLDRGGDMGFVKLSLGDIGWDTVNQGLLAHEDTIKEKPDLVRRFVAASMEALEYTAKNLDEAATIMVPRLPGISRDVIRKQVEAAASLNRNKRTEGKPLGWSHVDDWKNSLDLMVKGGQLKPTEVAEVTSYFTNEFIPAR